MGLFDKLRGKHPDPPKEDPASCTHTRLVPHWADLQGMGDGEKVTYYQCEACHTQIDREEGQALMRKAKER